MWYYVFSFPNNAIPVHKLVAYQKFWSDMLNEWIVVRHLNWDPRDNSYDNIDIWSQSDNINDIDPDIRMRNAVYASSFVKKHDHAKIYDMHIAWTKYSDIMRILCISSKWSVSYAFNTEKKRRSNLGA